MCQGRDKLEYHLAEYKSRSDSLSKKEQDTLRDMRIVQEMYARGFEFMPIDIYRAKARNFQIIDGKLMPSLSSIDGLGEKAADAIAFCGGGRKVLVERGLYQPYQGYEDGVRSDGRAGNSDGAAGEQSAFAV